MAGKSNPDRAHDLLTSVASKQKLGVILANLYQRFVSTPKKISDPTPAAILSLLATVLPRGSVSVLLIQF
jgi:hypothetical protein